MRNQAVVMVLIECQKPCKYFFKMFLLLKDGHRTLIGKLTISKDEVKLEDPPDGWPLPLTQNIVLASQFTTDHFFVCQTWPDYWTVQWVDAVQTYVKDKISCVIFFPEVLVATRFQDHPIKTKELMAIFVRASGCVDFDFMLTMFFNMVACIYIYIYPHVFFFII